MLLFPVQFSFPQVLKYTHMQCITHPVYSFVPEELELQITASLVVWRGMGLLSPAEISQNSQKNKESGYNRSHRDSIQPNSHGRIRAKQWQTHMYACVHVYECQLSPKPHSLHTSRTTEPWYLCTGRYPDICLSPKSFLASIQTKLHNKSMQMFK